MKYFKFPNGLLIVAFEIMMLAILLFAGSAGAATLTVNASGGADYTKIQDGIDNASAGDIVLIYSGTYYENVNVSRPLILKGVDTGLGKPVVNAMGSGNAITLGAGNSTLEGFTAVNASTFDYGIYLYFSSNSTLSNNNVSNNRGIYLYYSVNNTLIGNNVTTNSVSGYAVNLFNSSDNKLIGNNLSDNYNGIYTSNSNNILIDNNNISGSQEGILISSSSNNTLIGNNILNNGRGIILASSTNNMLRRNNILNNREGIYLGDSNSNVLVGNTASNNSAGIYIDRSGDNKIYNNLFNNTNNLRIFQVGYNIWNITSTNGTNIIGGLYLGGNVWASPDGTAFSQTCEDAKNDGICDSSYIIDGNNIDYLPVAYTEKFPTVIINLSGTVVVNQSTTYILSADYRNFNAGSPYNISITRKDDDSVVHTDNGTLKGERKEIIPINWIPIITGEYLVEARGNNTIAGKKTIFAVNAGAKMLTVGDNNSPADYMSIQKAVDNAGDGDVILVYSGIYGGMHVNKQLILKGIDTGGGKPIIDASVDCKEYFCNHYGPGNAVTLQSGNSTLDGFTITGGWSFAIPRSGGIDVASDNNFIKNNKISGNKYGIIIRGFANTLSGNEISNNSFIDVDLEGSGNTIYDNLFNDFRNFEIYNNSSNKWNIARTNGTNIMGGTYLGGNFWEGFSKACIDANRDGICDAQYTLDSNNTDHLPLAYEPFNNSTSYTVLPNSTITGMVTYSNNGTGIPDVSVNLTNITGTIIASETTDISGYYSISGIPEGNYSVNASRTAFFENSTSITLNASETMEVNLMLWLKDDLNNNGIPADAGDLVLMKRTSIGEITAVSMYDLNNNGLFADAGDLVLMKRASIGEIIE